MKKILFLCFEGLRWRFLCPMQPYFRLFVSISIEYSFFFVLVMNLTFYLKPNYLMYKITIKVRIIFLLSINCILLHDELS